ncbi:DUF305 domain-containing protein [Loktanella sp. DJP18]|uniref:DUF305 domain-containing protein n=1 Tax=Loktanella sp. DJP18 TaxID=3409788 RepID=UPI003BB57A59
MTTTTGAIAGLVIGAVVGVGGMMLLPGGSQPMDHAGMGDMPMTGNPDHDFMAGMVPHHQDAIDMANTVLETTDDAEVRGLAENILATQQAEIDQMNAWLAANPQE